MTTQTDTLPEFREAVRDWRAYLTLLRQRIVGQLESPESRRITQALLGLAAAFGIFFFFWLAVLIGIPTVRDAQDASSTEATIAYTADGKELTRYHLANRTWVGLDSIAKPVTEALIATEDHRFYQHNGVDVMRLIGAVVGTAGGDWQGGSTITMQLVRNVFPDIGDDWLLVRKLEEWLTAMRLEASLSKEEILEMYLNSVPFMYDAVGIEAASRTYFSKHAWELNVQESATLVGMLKATVYYNPYRNPERSHKRRNVVLQQMVRRGYLAEANYERIRNVPTTLHFRRLTRNENEAPYFAEYVRQWLNEWAETKGINLYTDGLRVYTTVDSKLQAAAESALHDVASDLQAVVDVEWSDETSFFSTNMSAYRAEREKVKPFAHFWETHPEYVTEILRSSPEYAVLKEQGLSPDSIMTRLRGDRKLVDSLKARHQQLEASFVAVEPSTGYVRAWVGGRDFSGNEYDHVAQARRQPGSTFKPFVYAAALENGYSPYSMVADQVVTYHDPNTAQAWSPKNFGGATGQLMTLGQGLAFSKNTITAQLITKVGPAKVVDLAHRMGIKSKLEAVPSLGLGTSDVNLLEMGAAYSTFVSNGEYHDPILVTRIEDRGGRVLAEFKPKSWEAVKPHVAYAVLDMMRGVINFGTGARLRGLFGASGDLAGKTGTTQNAADGWFMLAHPNLVMGAWVGFNTPMVTFRTDYWGQGAHNALHIVGEFYKRVRASDSEVLDPNATFKKPGAYQWGTGTRTTADDLTRQERESNNLDEVLEKLRAQRAAAEAAAAAEGSEVVPPQEGQQPAPPPEEPVQE